MKRNTFNNKAIAFLLVILLVLGSAPAAFADEVTSTEPSTGIIYKGKSVVDRWFYRDVDTTYTATDLFKNPGFKSVMPGDTLVQDFIVKNEAKNSIRLFMEVVAHDGVKNKLSDSVAAKTTTEQMIQFLNQMSLQVTTGEGDGEVVLFNIPANPENKPEIKGLGTFTSEKPVELGVLGAGSGTVLHAKLIVPITMNNDFANEIGEIDFRFTVQENEPGGGGGGKDPKPPKDPEEEIDDPDVPLDGPDEPTVIPGEPVEDIPDPKVPLGDAPKTGDNTKILPLMLLMIAALAGLVTTRKKLN